MEGRLRRQRDKAVLLEQLHQRLALRATDIAAKSTAEPRVWSVG